MIKIRIDRLDHKDAFGIWIIDYDNSNRTARIVKPTDLVFEPAPQDYSLPEPSFIIPRELSVEYAKALLNAYEESSLHNKEPINTKQVEAMNENLKDLRSVVDRLFMVIQK